MEQKEKELLLKDLTARLSYNTIVQIKNSGIWNLKGIDQDNFDEIGYKVIVWHGKNYPTSKNSFPITICKPYLFPLSSMTEEQYYDMLKASQNDCLEHMEVEKEWRKNSNFSHLPLYEYRVTDWFDKNHFDYRGLIEKGLALDATNKNIY